MAVIGAVVYCIHALSCALIGAASDRLIRHGTSPNRVRNGIMVAGSIGGAATIALTAITQTLAGARAAGQWFGMQGVAGQLAGVFAPIITGVIVDRTGQFAWAFTIAAGVLLAGAFAWALSCRESSRFSGLTMFPRRIKTLSRTSSAQYASCGH